MRHVPISILAIVAVVGIATLMLSVSLLDRPAPFATVFVGQAASSPSDTVIARLEVGEYLGNEVESLTGTQISGLRSGTVHGAEGRTDYVQSLRFRDPGTFNGARMVFGQHELGDVTDFLEFEDAVFKYQIEFGSGLQSNIEDNSLPDIEDEDIMLLGDTYSIVDSNVNTDSNRVSLKLFGGFGSIEFTDGNYADDNYYSGVKVNGQSIDALVKIKATESSDFLVIYSLQYILNANAKEGGDLQVLPLHCVREFLQYPLGMLSPDFDICYKGLSGSGGKVVVSGISGNEVRISPRGDDEYVMTATNTRGQTYNIPLAQLPGSYGNRGRNFVFVEAANSAAPNINVDDYFLVNSKNDISGSSHVLRYDRREGNQLYFEDLAGNSRTATFDSVTGEGQLLVGEGTYEFVVGAGDSLAMDQTNDNSISGGEARFVFAGGSRVDFGPGFTITITTPERLFDEAVADENTQFSILFGAEIDLNVPSPQGAVFELESVDGRKQGLTQYGILFDWDTESDSDSLRLIMPGSYSGGSSGGAGAEVWITFERAALMKPGQQVPSPVQKCGDGLIVAPEYCDPPASLCATPNVFERGTCSNDCKTCVAKPKAACGNKILEVGEQCEVAADCAAGLVCNGCKCQVPTCAIAGKCRVFSGCGLGTDQLMADGQAQGCVDPYKAAAEGVPYCGTMPISRGSLKCNYMDAQTKLSCTCPPAPILEIPSPVEKVSLWQK